jgi:hypothetical protein
MLLFLGWQPYEFIAESQPQIGFAKFSMFFKDTRINLNIFEMQRYPRALNLIDSL